VFITGCSAFTPNYHLAFQAKIESLTDCKSENEVLPIVKSKKRKPFIIGCSAIYPQLPLGFPSENQFQDFSQLPRALRANFSFDKNYTFFYKHMKFRNQARLCLAVFDFEAQIMLSL